MGNEHPEASSLQHENTINKTRRQYTRRRGWILFTRHGRTGGAGTRSFGHRWLPADDEDEARSVFMRISKADRISRE